MNPEELKRLYESGRISYEEYLQMSQDNRNQAPAGTIGGTPQMSGVNMGGPEGQSSNPYAFLFGQSNPQQNNVSDQGSLMTDNPSAYGGQGDIDRQGRLIPRGDQGQFGNTTNRLRFGDQGYASPSQSPQGLTEEEFIEYRQESDVAAGKDQLPYEEYQRMYQGNQNQGQSQTNQTQGRNTTGMPYINPGGSSYSSRLYLAGKGFANKDNKGLGTLQGIAGLASAGIGMAGDFLSGFASKKRENYIEDWERKQRLPDRNYVAAPQYRDSNYTNEMDFQDGGIFDPVRRQERKNERKASPGMKLFPDKYGDENYFENVSEGESTVQNVGYTDPGFFGSMKKAMELNKETRDEGLDRDKVRLLAFHNRKPTERTNFKDGGKTPEGKNGDVKKSWRDGKKLAVYMDGKFHHFGEKGAPDYRSHKDKDRKKAWYDRHAKALKGDDPRAKAFRIYAKKTWEDGGEMSYEDGGDYGYEDGGMPMPQEQQQQTPQGQGQQMMAMVSQALQQGAEPQQIVQTLVQQGVPQQQAVQMVQQVVQAMQQQGQPQMEYGGLFGKPLNEMPQGNELLGKKPGDPITFKYGGKKYSGTVDKIENGKLFLR